MGAIIHQPRRDSNIDSTLTFIADVNSLRIHWHQPLLCGSFSRLKESFLSQRVGPMGLTLSKRLLLLGALLASAPTFAQSNLPDPQGSGVIVGAMGWLQGTLLGTAATVAAVIAVAAVGFMMLTGRINWRHGAVVILGCFILFGAASIVGGIRAAAGG
jgi:type IV secretory pathway VirB2 component (pilin)